MSSLRTEQVHGGLDPRFALGTCASCGAPIVDAHAHFCNLCGRPVAAHPTAPGSPPTPRRRRWPLVLAVVVTALVAAAVAAIVLRQPEAGSTATATSARASNSLHATLDPTGATLQLAGGMSVVVRAGAVERPTDLALRIVEGRELADAPTATGACS